MQNIIISIIILFGIHACSSSIQTNKKKSQPPIEKSITIDIDEEFSILESLGRLRNESSKVLDNPIYIGDNDEVSFKGNFLEKNAPISIKIGNNKPIISKGKIYTIKTMEVNNGEMIQMKDKNGKVFLEMEVLK